MAIKDRAVDMDDLLHSLNYSAKHCELGISGIAANTAYQEQTLRNKLSPGDVSHSLSFSDFVMVLKQSEDTTPIDVLCNMFGGQFVSKTEGSSSTIMQAVLNVMREHGDVARVLDEVMADGVIDDVERQHLHREILEVRNALLQLENTVNRNRS